jgi:hypothetical protein
MVADAAGIPRSEFARIMTGGEFPVEHLLAVAKALDVPVSDFISTRLVRVLDEDFTTQVLEHHFGGDAVPIAGFDREEDAFLFIQAIEGLRSDCTYSTRMSPAAARRYEQYRQLRRDPQVTEALMGMDA